MVNTHRKVLFIYFWSHWIFLFYEMQANSLGLAYSGSQFQAAGIDVKVAAF